MHARLASCFARPIAHRGLHGAGGVGPIENSMGAAAAAIAAGYGIECDVQLSRDGEAVVFHDRSLDRLTSATGLVHDRPVADLAAISLGTTSDTIPSFASFLSLIAGRVPLVIEIKSFDVADLRLADRVVSLVAGYRGDVVIESFDPTVVLHCLEKAPCPVGLVGPTEHDEAMTRQALEACHFVSWAINDLAGIAAAQPDKVRTSWTIRSPLQQTVATRLGAQIVFEGFDPRGG